MSYEDKRYDDSETFCCIAGCHHIGNHKDGSGRLFCDEHWKDKTEEDPTCGEGCDGCNGCSVCSVPGCGKEGIIHQAKTGKVFCVDHAWKYDRPDDFELPPAQAKMGIDDLLRAHGSGITVRETGLPDVSPENAEKWKRELEEEGKLLGWSVRKDKK
jgi:hypothetical protein